MVERLRPKSLASMAQTVSDRFALVAREDNSKLVGQTQRFELWATSLGLYHLGHSSLDYRFRDAPSLFEYTVGLLRDLEGLLVQLMDTRNPGHLSSVDTKNTIGSHEQFSDDSGEDDFESSDDESITDLLLGSVSATIDKLYHLSFKIRNPAMRLGFSESLKYHEIDPETGVNLIDQFRENDQRHLEQLFASYRSLSPANFEKDFLVRRLAKANTRRRQQFGYWKRRAQFETIFKKEIIDKTAPELENDPNLNVPAVPIAPSRPSTATHLNVSKVNMDDDTSMVSSLTIPNMKYEGSGGYFFIPPPPKHLLDGEEFECPYCFTLCPRKMLHQTNWQTHVLRDLRPYICTYEDCRDADQQYDRLGDWINHEAFTHQRKSGINSSNNENLSIQESRKCPFCFEIVGRQHIATHLRRVACFSLPRSTGSDDESSQDSQISGRADLRSNKSRCSEIRCETSFGGAESVSEAGPEVDLKNNIPLTLESLQQQQPDPKDKESKVNIFLERLESESADSHHTPPGIDPTSISDFGMLHPTAAWCVGFPELENPEILEKFDFDSFLY
ncbi:uncharacterized protein TRUGW13939_04996 [Talaromyces rugulosus]|uniref:Oxidoreductase acuF-like C2H2 type zinc-finger domain-containing protein n=1 Tax=Talaromyces rugulosus TaxID=121627 RepID=A0A7H8QVM4_TALRU|nr:uncharacterized protein TRUGW13939_04996 [Talaromyces rugulosus]QKX57876.1 hypothetical protein TRUGW13939_04996 [Talaromyces rugulosus]